MTVAVAYKWASNPQEASVSADGVVDWSRAKPSVSEYDPVAIQFGRLLADADGGELLGLSVGTTGTAGSLAKKAAMSRGLDRGVVVADDDVATWNLTKVAEAIAQLVRRAADVDVLLAGDASIDENAKMVPALVAGYLDWPCFQDVAELRRTGDGWSLTQNVAGGTRSVEVSGPVVVSVASDAVQPKVPGMKDILAAGKKPVEEVSVADLGLAASDVEIVGRRRPASKARKNVIVADADALVSALRTDGLL
jgi:electron transfer flavoprotein beta subunit